ncbi:sialin-like [Lytechinus variegatus]|uniref:sialin-like n=1 Tax=Lytechinus variegatus TaxID=7654 RepID=UPI001BB225DE|nr:sialin-like [Lytechinus variegatus]
MSNYKYSKADTDNDENLGLHRPLSPGGASGLQTRSNNKHVITDVATSKVLSQDSEDELAKPPNGLCSMRYFVTYLSCFGFFTVFLGRSTLSVAMTVMVNSTSNHELYIMSHQNQSIGFQVCHASGPTNMHMSIKREDGPFHWNSWTQELILASGFYGFPWLQIPAGFLADANGNAAVWLLAIGFGGSALCTLLTPFVAYQGVPLLVTIQIISGILQSWIYPVFIALMVRWAPPRERSRLTTIGTSGIPLAQVIGQPIAGLWSSSESTGGWPSAFYFSGTLGVLCSIAWVFFVYPSPSAHPRISPRERNYIEQNLLLESRKPETYPWKSILASGPVLAVCVAIFSHLWILYLFMTNLPIYLKAVLQFDIKQTGFLAAVPFFFFWLVWTVGGRLADFLIAHTNFRVTTVRKFITFLAFMPPAVLLVLMGYVGCNTVAIMVILTLGLSMNGLSMSGPSMCPLDFAPSYAGIISAIANVFATTSGFLVPLLIAQFTEDQASY